MSRPEPAEGSRTSGGGSAGEAARADAATGHTHRCREGHTWYHTARPCPVREYQSGAPAPYTSPEDCPLCTGQDDALRRGPHPHRCPTCDGAWTHEGRCPEGPAAQCPWCFQWGRPTPPSGLRPGPHRHDCPRCLQTWRHEAPCAAPLRAALDGCPTCDPASPTRSEGQLVSRSARVPTSSVTPAHGAAPHRRLRRVIVAAALLVVGGAWLAPTPTREPARDADPEQTSAPLTAAPAPLPGPRPGRSAAPAMPAAPVLHPAPTTPPIPPHIIARPPAVPLLRAGDARLTEQRIPADIVAVRYTVRERTPSEWTWSWRLLVQSHGDLPGVSARLAFVEFQGSASRLVAHQDVCGIHAIAGQLVAIEGTHTISADASGHVSAVTAALSRDTACADAAPR